MKLRFFPADSFQIPTKFSAENIRNILQENISPKKLFRTNNNHLYFKGEISKGKFRIMRIIHYRNSFLPVIEGTIIPEANGCIITIKMTLHPIVAVFTTFWFSCVILILIAIIIIDFLKPEKANFIILLPITGMLVFGIVLVSGSFSFEAKRQKEKLLKLFKKQAF